MPEAPVAPAPAAPSAPAPSAPAAPATPAAPPTPTPAAPAAPAPPATPAAPVPPAAAAPATPAKYDPKTAAAPPSQKDYPEGRAGMEQFIEDNGQWTMLHPEEAAKLQGADKPEAAPDPIAEAAKAAEGEKPAEPAKPEAPVAAATPAVIDEWTGKSPELKAAFDKDPALRDTIMGMARENEAAKPVLEIVSTKEEAQFAVENANRLVTLQANWMLGAEDPDMLNSAWDQTVDMFKERDANGAEIKGADGKPKLGADFQPFVRKAASTAMGDLAASAGAQVTAIQARLAGVYPNEEARTADTEALDNANYEKAAFDFVLHRLQNPDEAGTKLPALPAGATKEQIDFQKQLEDRSKAEDARTGKNTVAERKAANKAIGAEVQKAYEVGINSYIDTQVAAMVERGEYLPDFVLNDKWINPQTGQPTKVSAFGARIYLALNAKINNNPLHAAKLMSLEALGAPGKDARMAEMKRLQGLYLPKIFQTEVTRIQDGIRNNGKKPAPATPGQPPVARVEPQSQGTVVPSGMNDDQIRTWAEGEAKKKPDFAGMNAQQREETIMTIYSQKKYFGG